jgi:hypothetical protein
LTQSYGLTVVLTQSRGFPRIPTGAAVQSLRW